jgi:hypothetical protein
LCKSTDCLSFVCLHHKTLALVSPIRLL